ncbi:membrane protein [Aureimonas sp. SA4125]|uniref:NfeD family protein n=1 Tax=Aureimonas sp. SA4125 TaxID=2826993 RepID=UPI001CC40AB1|nr:NfeD family protein [Aureimonas sp. SA4125]BDA83499.1 membrane protein [Aureimonas sp. SA4125]
MSAVLADVGAYGWWIAGMALLVLEIVVPGVYLLFPGLAALVVGTNALLLGDSFGWQQQVIAFVVVSLAAVLVGRRWYGAKTVRAEPLGQSNRADRLVGTTATLSEAIVGHRGKVAIEDGWWIVEGPDLPQNARVRITGARGAVLMVEPLDPPGA